MFEVSFVVSHNGEVVDITFFGYFAVEIGLLDGAAGLIVMHAIIESALRDEFAHLYIVVAYFFWQEIH